MININTDIFTVCNRYGYQLNVNHPVINDLYRRFKEWKGYNACEPLTDEQRLEFEEYVMPILQKKLAEKV